MGCDPRLARRLAAAHAAGLAVLVFAGACYFSGLGRPSLWFDEAYSAAFAALAWSKLWEVMRAADGQFAAYYAFLHVWTSIGNSEAVLRAPSVLAALVALGATYALGHVLFGR